MAGARYPAAVVAAGVLLTLPSLWGGLQADDLVIRWIIRNSYPVPSPVTEAWEKYTWLDGDPDTTREWMDRGFLVWWIDPHARARLFRPLSTLTHVLDHSAWPDQPWLMHVHSLAWFALLIWLVAVLYRRLMAQSASAAGGWVAALAALLYAVDDARGVPAGWLAQRNSLVAGVFGVATLILHDRWRRDRWRPGACLAPLALLAAVLGKEEAVAAGGYLLAYALILDRGSWRSRLLSLLPSAAVGVGWYAFYRGMGFGTFPPGLYTDPGQAPMDFVWRIVRQVPPLLWGQWLMPTSDVAQGFAPSAFWGYWFVVVVVLAALAAMFRSLLRQDAVARFWAVGMLLACVPICAAPTSDRLLTFVGVGGAGLLARWLGETGAEARRATARVEAHGSIRSNVRWSRRGLIAVHLVAAPLLLPMVSVGLWFVGEQVQRYSRSLPDDPAIAEQTTVIVNPNAWLGDTMALFYRMEAGKPVPAHSLILGAACSPVEVERLDDTTVAVRPRGGYFRLAAAPAEREKGPPWSVRHAMWNFDLLMCSPDRLPRLGQVIDLAAARIEITKLTPDGRPAEAVFRFRAPLEHPSLRWFTVTSRGYVPFIPPAIGQTVEVPDPLDSG